MKNLTRLVLLVILMLTASVIVAQDDDLRVVNFDVEEDFYAEVEFTWEADDISMLFNVKTADGSGFIYLTGIYTADDELIYESENEESVIVFGFPPEVEATESDPGGELSVFLPSSPAFDFEPGDYYFVFESEESPIQEISAIVRSGNADDTQAIDFNFWVLTENLIDAEDQNIFEDEFRNTVDEMLNPSGLGVGEVNYFVADEDTFDQFSVPAIGEEDESSLQALCAAMGDEVGTTRAMNVAIIEGFDEGGEGDTTGVSISIGTGGVIMQPSPYSCVVASYEAYEDDLAGQAVNIFHEAGHFMSLPHTTEAEGDAFDMFDDTPECYIDESDEDGDGAVSDLECGSEGGGDNVMFWGNDDPEPKQFYLSEQQVWVLRRHPLFYPVGN